MPFEVRSMDLTIRPVDLSDSEAIAAIYDHHARTGTATFDHRGPSPKDWADTIRSIRRRGWPFLAATIDDRVVGYAYATQFRDRPGYAKTCENSIYVAAEHVGQGIGRRLLDALVASARHFGFEQMIAVIGGGEPASIALHRRLGFVERGRMRDVGMKFGRRLDTIYLQLDLRGEG